MESATLIDPPMISPISPPPRRARSRVADSHDARERPPAFHVERLSIFYGDKKAIEDVTLAIPSKKITAIIGPSGCGKSSFLRSLNRMHELVPNTHRRQSLVWRRRYLCSAGRSCSHSA